MTTKICENCVTKIDDMIRFRKLCALTDIKIRNLMAAFNESDGSFESGVQTLSELPSVATEIRIVEGGSVGQNDDRLSTGKRKSADMDSADSEA